MFFSLQFFHSSSSILSLHLGSLWLTSSSTLFEREKNSDWPKNVGVLLDFPELLTGNFNKLYWIMCRD